MKSSFILAGLALISQSAMALPRFSPERCAHDNLPQWSEGTAVDGTARGRNAWLQSCFPREYRTAYPGGNEFEPNSNRRAYVTYGIITSMAPNHDIIFDPGPWRAGTSPAASMDSSACAIPGNYDLVGYCTSGCVTPDQEIESANGALAIIEMQKKKIGEVTVPTRGSGDNFEAEILPVRRYTKDMAPAQQTIILITTASGKQLKLSTNHPMLTSDYKMKNADQLKAGDKLVSASGQLDAIVSSQAVPYFGRVYNLTVETDDLQKSMYIVQGFVSGDKKFQDLSVSEMNRKFIRRLAAKLNQ